MKLTSRGRYAVTAMLDIALHGKEMPVSLADISDRQAISLSYLEQLFAQLRREGIVHSVRGLQRLCPQRLWCLCLAQSQRCAHQRHRPLEKRTRRTEPAFRLLNSIARPIVAGAVLGFSFYASNLCSFHSHACG